MACGRQLRRGGKPFASVFWAQPLIFLALFWAPTELLLLIRHPSWETMQAAASFADLPVWLVLAFSISNISQGMLGFWVGQKLMHGGAFIWPS